MAKDTLKSDFQQFLDRMCVKYDMVIDAEDIAKLWNDYTRNNPDVWTKGLAIFHYS